MNISDISTQLLYTTVPIWVEHLDGNITSATSFIVNKKAEIGIIPFLVTNKHVIQNAKNVIIKMAKMENDMPSKNEGITIELNLSDVKCDDTDIAAFPIGHLLNKLQLQNSQVFFRALSDEMFPDEEKINNLSAIEEIIFIGYPSGIYDSENLTPLVRKGITATPLWNDFQKQPKFIIDAGVFPGSSGSPVFIFNPHIFSSENNIHFGVRLLFLGILTEYLQRSQSNNINVYLNLGQVIKGEILNKFLNSLIKEINDHQKNIS